MIPPEFKVRAPHLKLDVYKWMKRNNVFEIVNEIHCPKKNWDCDEYYWTVKTDYGRKLTIKTSHGYPYFA